MSELITTQGLGRRPPENVEIIKPKKPLTTLGLPRRVEKVETRRVRPILTLGDLRGNKTRLGGLPRAAPARLMPGGRRGYNANLKEMLRPKSLWNIMPRNLWQGRRCFIVGGGPSLNGFDWSLLDGEISIGINRAFEKFNPTMMFCMDPRVWGWIVRGDFGQESTEKYEQYKGTRVWINMSNFIFPDDVYVVDLNELQPCGSNSGHAAINLAMLLGANPIYLLGFDMRGNSKGGQEWFHNGYPVTQTEGVYDGFLKALNGDVGRIKNNGTQVVNLTPKSALKCFPTDKIGNIVKPRKAVVRPIVISYYTENTGYENEAAQLIKSIVKFGLEYDVVPKPNMGGWKANTYYKAQFIREMMDKYPDRNLLWVDADAIIVSYPTLFDNMKEDIGVFIADWDKIGNYKIRLSHVKIMTGIETLSGTLYVANNSRSKAFIDAWIALNKKQFAHTPMEQTNLCNLLGYGKNQAQRKLKWTNPLTVHHLPPSYCQIWDTMAYLGEPVIEHHQAARRLKGEVGK